MILRTTHITGVVTDLGVLLGRWLRHRRVDTWQFALLVFTLLAFLLGGVVGALLSYRLGGNALWGASGVTLSSGSLYFAWRHYWLKAQEGTSL